MKPIAHQTLKAVNVIGHGLALARGCLTKHAIKQVDRLLSNRGIEVDFLLARWAPYMVGSRPRIAVAMDWTDFDADGQSLPSRRRGRRSCCRCSRGMAGRRRWSG